MPTIPNFPHLTLLKKGSFKPKFKGGSKPNPEVVEIRKNPSAHALKIRGILQRIRDSYTEAQQVRIERGLPQVPAGTGFLLKIPEQNDVEPITKALGLELVAETDEGLMLIASEDIDFQKLEQVLQQFSLGEKGGLTAGSSIIDIYDQADDYRRLQVILDSKVNSLWPLNDTQIYIFDVGIQTATSSRSIDWPTILKRKDETNQEYLLRKDTARRAVIIAAETEWIENAETRIEEVKEFVYHYQGEFLTGIMDEGIQTQELGVIYPDSVQIRIKMCGEGFRDVILNFPHLFDVCFPPTLQPITTSDGTPLEEPTVTITAPSPDSPSVCIIDSGIQEEHRWLAPAIDRTSSRCFLPGKERTDSADYVAPKGHGTRVAGAVLYPRQIPLTGQLTPVTWIQNARVLDEDNMLPESLTPESYLHQVVDHFNRPPFSTKIFNHSINENGVCDGRRMSAWAAKIDQLSHEKDILFIQSTGNATRETLQQHLHNGTQPPNHQLEASMRVANPAQSLHALTVGSISELSFENEYNKSFALTGDHPSGFSRTGYGEPWNTVKPEVVEYGGDLVFQKDEPFNVRFHPEVSVELLNSTFHGNAAFSRDSAGTSFSTPKVTHIAANLQSLFPAASPLLYRALIVQSAKWPQWTNGLPTDNILRLIGYGIPSVERATENGVNRITLITPDATVIRSKEYHLFTIIIPPELQNIEANIRVDVTLAYSSLPRRTRARRTGYLEAWLDWTSSKLEEPIDEFQMRMQNGGKSSRKEFPWLLRNQDNHGEAQETNRTRGTVQKDWAMFRSYELPQQFAIAVRAHKGWNHLDGAGTARYCLAVTFEAEDVNLPIYNMIESQIEVETDIQLHNEIVL